MEDIFQKKIDLLFKNVALKIEIESKLQVHDFQLEKERLSAQNVKSILGDLLRRAITFLILSLFLFQ